MKRLNNDKLGEKLYWNQTFKKKSILNKDSSKSATISALSVLKI